MNKLLELYIKKLLEKKKKKKKLPTFPYQPEQQRTDFFTQAEQETAHRVFEQRFRNFMPQSEPEEEEEDEEEDKENKPESN